jgi:hypothetical protein
MLAEEDLRGAIGAGKSSFRFSFDWEAIRFLKSRRTLITKEYGRRVA